MLDGLIFPLIFRLILGGPLLLPNKGILDDFERVGLGLRLLGLHMILQSFGNFSELLGLAELDQLFEGLKVDTRHRERDSNFIIIIIKVWRFV